MEQTQSQSFEEMKECIICIDSIKEGEYFTTIPICKHEMHMKCLKEWIQIKNSCPICRSEIKFS